MVCSCASLYVACPGRLYEVTTSALSTTFPISALALSCAIIFKITECKISPISSKIKRSLQTSLLLFCLQLGLGETINLHVKLQNRYQGCDSQLEMEIHLQYRVRWLGEVELKVYFSPTYLLLGWFLVLVTQNVRIRRPPIEYFAILTTFCSGFQILLGT